MSEKWDFYFCLIEDQPASIYLDMGLIDLAPIRGFDRFGYVRLYMRNPRLDGLSSNEEFEKLGQIEDSLTPAIGHGCQSYYVGRTTSDGARTYYFYMDDGARFESLAARAMATFPEYETDIGNREDPEWQVYRGFLFPSEADRQRIENRHVTDALRDNGDQLEASRVVEHWAYFDDRASADKFTKFALGEGFRIAKSGSISDGKYQVQFDRTDRPSEIDDITLPLHARALELGGEYDGWGCEVVART